MSLLARRGLIVALAMVCGVVVLTAAMSQAATLPPEVAGGSIAGPTPIPCTNGTSNVPCRMALTASGPFVVCDAGKCSVPLSGKFTLAVEMVSVPKAGYILAQSWIEFGNNLSYNLAPTVHGVTKEIVWPDCEPATALRSDTLIGFVGHGCLTGLAERPASHEVGVNLIEISITCSAAVTSTLVRLVPSGEPPAGTSGTLFMAFLNSNQSVQVVPDLSDLTVHCVVPDPNAPTLTPTRTPTDTLTPSETPTGTLTPATATPTPSQTPTGTLTPATATPTPSQTPTGTLTPATATPTPSNTPTGTLTPVIATPLATATSTASQTSTNTPIPTHTPTPRPSLLGDVSCDGRVDPVDAVLLMQLEAGFIEELPCPDAGDVDGDGQTTLIDATLILQFSAGLISSLPP